MVRREAALRGWGHGPMSHGGVQIRVKDEGLPRIYEQDTDEAYEPTEQCAAASMDAPSTRADAGTTRGRTVNMTPLSLDSGLSTAAPGQIVITAAMARDARAETTRRRPRRRPAPRWGLTEAAVALVSFVAFAGPAVAYLWLTP